MSPERAVSTVAKGPREPLVISSIFLLALAVRLVYLIQIQASPFFSAPVADAGWHDAWAMSLLQEGWKSQGVFFRAPLYPYFLAAMYAVFGHDVFSVRVIQIALGSLGCVLVYLIGRTLFDRTAGWIAGLMASLYGVLVYFDAELLIAVLIVPLDLLLLFLVISRWRRYTWVRWTLAGLVAGLSAIARPNILLFVPVLLAWAWWSDPARRREVMAGVGLLGLVAGLVMLPVIFHNLRAGDGAVLISSQGGINFYIGNGAEADGKISAPPGGVVYEDSRQQDNVWAASERIAQQAMGRPLKPSQVSSYWFKKALGEIRDRPGRWLGLMARKIYFLCNGHEIESNQSVYTHRQWSWLLAVLVWKKVISFPFGLLVPLAAVGLWSSRRNWKKHLPVYLFLLSYGLTVVAFFVNSRFRLPLVPVLIVYAARGAIWAVRQARAGKVRTLVWPAALFAGLLLFCNSHLFAVAEVNVAREHYLQAVAYERMGQPQQAAEQYRICLRLDPYTIQAHYNVAKIYRQAGYLDAAIIEFQEALALRPDFAEGYNGLGIAYAQKGELDLAVEQFRRSLDIQPDHGWTWLNLANVYFQRGIPDSALAMYRRAQQLLPEEEYIRQQILELERAGTP